MFSNSDGCHIRSMTYPSGSIIVGVRAAVTVVTIILCQVTMITASRATQAYTQTQGQFRPPIPELASVQSPAQRRGFERRRPSGLS